MKTYTIKEGKHYCKGLHFGVTSTVQKFKFRFNTNCLYDETQVIPGWNKLYGWASLNNHKNSVRLAWRCEKGKLIVGYYCYVKGVRIDGDLIEVEPGVWYDAECSEVNRQFVCRVETNYKVINGAKKPCIAFINRFYFGGNSTAPHTMNLDIEKLN